MASLFCSVWVLLGFIPGMICGHLARAKMRRNPLLKGKGMATAGLVISYTMMGLLLAVFGTPLLVYHLAQPRTVRRESVADLAKLQPRIVDEVKFGPEAAGGNESEHKLMSRGSSRSLTFAHKPCRDGTGFCYEMKVLPDQAMSVNCRYYGSENPSPPHGFDLIVDNQIIGTQELGMNDPGHYLDVEYKIPPGITKGKSKVTVEFQARGGTTGKIFALETLRR